MKTKAIQEHLETTQEPNFRAIQYNGSVFIYWNDGLIERRDEYIDGLLERCTQRYSCRDKWVDVKGGAK